MRTTIVIPTCGTYHLLDACLRGIYDNTDINRLQIIVVCNGSDDSTARLVMQNGLQMVWNKEAIGFTRATNMGLKLVENPTTIVMNTDAHILNYWEKNKWLDLLLEPLKDEQVGITGLSKMYSEWGDFIPFYLTAIKTKLFDELGYLDEDFSPGYGEDLDFCIRAKRQGYKIAAIDEILGNKIEDHENQMVISSYPIYHRGEQSFTKDQRDWCLQNAHEVLNRKWGNENHE